MWWKNTVLFVILGAVLIASLAYQVPLLDLATKPVSTSLGLKVMGVGAALAFCVRALFLSQPKPKR
jgi:hypothetical protein